MHINVGCLNPKPQPNTWLPQLNTFSSGRRERILAAAARSCYLEALSVHAYSYYSKDALNQDSLLSEDLMRELSRNASAHVRGAAEFGKVWRFFLKVRTRHVIYHISCMQLTGECLSAVRASPKPWKPKPCMDADRHIPDD